MGMPDRAAAGGDEEQGLSDGAGWATGVQGGIGGFQIRF